MKIYLDDDYHIDMGYNLLGYVGEHESRTVELVGYAADDANAYRLRLCYSDGVTYDVGINDGACVIQSSLLRRHGTVKGQILALNIDGENCTFVKKSNVFDLVIGESLGDETEPIPTPEIAVDALAKIQQSENNAKLSEENAKESETQAKASETNAKTSETNAKASETNAKESENVIVAKSQEIAKIAESIPAEYTTLSNDVDELKGDLDELSGHRNLLNISIAENDKAHSINKGIYDAKGYLLTDYIPVNYGKTLYFSNDGVAIQVDFISTFDSSKNAIATEKLQNDFLISDNIAYVRITQHGNTTSLSKMQIEYDEITPFKKYVQVADISDMQNNLAEIQTNIPDMQDNIAEIQTNISDMQNNLAGIQTEELSRNLFNKDAFIADTEIRYNGDIISSSNKVGLTDYISAISGRSIYFSNNGSALPKNNVYYIAEYDSSKNFIQRIEANDAGYVYDVPTGVAYIRVVVSNSIVSTFQVEYDRITPYVTYTNRKIIHGDNITDIENDVADLKNSVGSIYDLPDSPLARINDCPELMSCFLTVGCIGDSLASGVAVYKDSEGNAVVNSVNRYEYSWGQYLARMTGNKYYNWSSGGLRTDTWLLSSHANECFDGNHLCQAYIIGLGQNDNNKWHGENIGTSADIDLSDYNNNADSFYGRYAKIIQKILVVQPKAKIFIITDPNDSVDANGYNTAIRTISDMFDSVYLMDMRLYWSDAPCAALLNNQKRYGHFNAVGYFLIAKMIMSYVDWIIQTNWEDFREIENIGTDWYYYDELK